MLDTLRAAGITRGILVDVSAADGMESTLTHALNLGYGIALANKKALAGPLHSAKSLLNNTAVRHESTVV